MRKCKHPFNINACVMSCSSLDLNLHRAGSFRNYCNFNSSLNSITNSLPLPSLASACLSLLSLCCGSSCLLCRYLFASFHVATAVADAKGRTKTRQLDPSLIHRRRRRRKNMVVLLLLWLRRPRLPPRLQLRPPHRRKRLTTNESDAFFIAMSLQVYLLINFSVIIESLQFV